MLVMQFKKGLREVTEQHRQLPALPRLSLTLKTSPVGWCANNDLLLTQNEQWALVEEGLCDVR